MKKLNSRKSLLAVGLLLSVCVASRAQSPQPTQTPTPQTPTPQAQATPPTSPQSSQGKGSYEALVERAKKGDAGVDFTALRMAFYETENYNPIAPMMTYRPLWGAVQQGDWAGAIKLAASVLEKNFVEVNAHMVAFIAHRQSGDAERAKFHRAIAEGLLNSIKASGDGKTTATAFEVISTSEEYGLFRSMNLSPVKQSLLEEKGNMFDAIETVDPRTNARATFYFRVDKPLKWNDRKRKQ
jgi:hypothetical protein